MASTLALRKEVLLVQNLQLLGFVAEDPRVASGNAATPKALHADAFDRPNERLLFRVLHFLLAPLESEAAQEFRYCWPAVTPPDKTKFKRIVHTLLSDLEKEQALPVGSSQASRINTGYGPRVVDLLWRLSSHVVKTTLAQEFPRYPLRPPPSTASSSVSTAEALAAIKARIVVKTHQFKQQCVAGAHVQDQWCSFAAELTRHIQDISALQKQVDDDQKHLKVVMSRDIFSQERKAARAVAIEEVNATWQSIEAQLDSATHGRNQLVLETTVQYSQEQPVLSAAKLRPQEAFQDRRSGRLDLGDTVKSAEQLIRRVQGCIQQGDIGEPAVAQDTASLVDASNRHLATLNNMVQQLQRVLAKLKDANELEARGLYAELATQEGREAGKGAASLAGHAIKLCPPTPALPPHEESQLAGSLKNVSMTELSGFSTESMRRSDHKKNQQWMESEGEAAAGHDTATTRKLQFGEEHRDEEME